MHVTTLVVSQGIIPSFAVLHTEKLAFQYATLLSWECGLQGDKAMNLPILCGDFRTILFLLSVSVPQNKKKKKPSHIHTRIVF